MDIMKKKKKTSNIFTVYLKAKDMELIEILREKNVNISMVCRLAIRETAEKLRKGGGESERLNRLVVKCNGKVTINMEENEFIFDNIGEDEFNFQKQKLLIEKEEFKEKDFNIE
jgi:post-segregation antitoxin (ccd killing protein)